MEIISRRCPICGNTTELKIKSKNTLRKIRMYGAGMIMVQQIPLCPSSREFIKTGICKPCQRIYFAPMEDDYE